MSKDNRFQAMDDSEGVLPRSKLPQIPKKLMPRFVKELQTRGIRVRARTVPACNIIPLQMQAEKDKLRLMQPDVEKFERDVFLVSRDNHLLDGHHRWLILKGGNKERPIRTIQIDLSTKDLVRFAFKFRGQNRKGAA